MKNLNAFNRPDYINSGSQRSNIDDTFIPSGRIVFNHFNISPSASEKKVIGTDLDQQPSNAPDTSIKNRLSKLLSSIKTQMYGSTTTKDRDTTLEYIASLKGLSPLSKHLLTNYTTHQQREAIIANDLFYRHELSIYDPLTPSHTKDDFIVIYEHDNDLWCHLMCSELPKGVKNKLKHDKTTLVRLIITPDVDIGQLEWDDFF